MSKIVFNRNDELGELNDFLKSAKYTSNVALVNDEQHNFFGMVLDEIIYPVASIFKIGEYDSEIGDMEEYVPIDQLSKAVRLTDKKLEILFNDTDIELNIDGTNVKIAYVTVDYEDEINKNNLSYISGSFDGKIIINQDAIKQMGHISSKNNYENAAIKNGKIVYGSLSHIIESKIESTDEVSMSFSNIFIKKLAGMGSEIQMEKYEDALVVKNNNIYHIAIDTFTDFVEYGVVFEQDNIAEMAINVNNHDKIMSEMEKLQIPLMKIDEKVIDFFIEDGKLHLKVSGMRGKLSKVTIETNATNKGLEEDFQVNIEDIMPIIKDNIEGKFYFKENGLIFKVDNITHIIARVYN